MHLWATVVLTVLMYSSQLSNYQLLKRRPMLISREVFPSSEMSFVLVYRQCIVRELTQHDAALKKLKTATASIPKFKKKGNENQFLLNSEVLEHVHSASTVLQASSPQVEKALEELKEGENKLSQRNKLILIADSSEEGWEVVNEYQCRDLADDSDDDKRIRQAEVKA